MAAPAHTTRLAAYEAALADLARTVELQRALATQAMEAAQC